jgi:hypothetical protein
MCLLQNVGKLLIDEKREKACFLHGWLVLYKPLLHLCIQGKEAQTLRSPTPKRKKLLVPAAVLGTGTYLEAVFRIRIRKCLGLPEPNPNTFINKTSETVSRLICM